MGRGRRNIGISEFSFSLLFLALLLELCFGKEKGGETRAFSDEKEGADENETQGWKSSIGNSSMPQTNHSSNKRRSSRRKSPQIPSRAPPPFLTIYRSE
jgi:hypothetical protein